MSCISAAIGIVTEIFVLTKQKIVSKHWGHNNFPIFVSILRLNSTQNSKIVKFKNHFYQKC